MKYFIGDQTYEGYEPCSMQFVRDYLIQQTAIGLDIETSRKFKKGTYDERVYKGGLDPYLSRICMVQVGTLEHRFIIDARVVPLDLLLPILTNRHILKVGANLVFEWLHFKHNYDIEIQGLYDVQTVDRIMTNGLYDSYSLEALMKRYRGFKTQSGVDLFGQSNFKSEVEALFKVKSDEWALLFGTLTDDKESELWAECEEIISEKYVDKSIRLEFVDLGDKPFTQRQLDYGDTDIVEPLELRLLFMKGRKISYGREREGPEKFEQYYPKDAIKMENKVTECLGEMIYRGVCLDKPQWLELARTKYVEYLTRIEFLNEYVATNHPQFTNGVDLFTSKPTCAIQWSSSKQVQLLFDKMEITVLERSKATGKMEKTVGAKALLANLKNEDKVRFMEWKWPEAIVTKEDLTVSYLLVKKLQQLTTTFGPDFMNYIHPITGRIHCNFRQYLNTTRLAATKPNMLAIPRDKEYRMCFIAPEGYKVWACDYSSQEVAMLAEIFNNQTLKDFFIRKGTDNSLDIHSNTATLMYRIIYENPDFVCDKKKHKTERQNAKILTFQIPYGASGKGVSSMLGTGVEEAEEFIKFYYKSYPGLEEAFIERRKLGMKQGWIQICHITDKRYFFREFEAMNMLAEEARSYFPQGYYDKPQGFYKWPKEKRDEYQANQAKIKEKVYEDYPRAKQCWREWSMLKGKWERRIINFSIQSPSATQSKMALLYMKQHRETTGQSEDWWPVLLIHDEFEGYIKTELVDSHLHIPKDLMLKGARSNVKSIPVFAEMEVGDHWIH